MHVRCDAQCAGIGAYLEALFIQPQFLGNLLDRRQHGGQECAIQCQRIQQGRHMLPNVF
ncbi:MAG: hypothetical protein ABSF99_05135 [Anaerolineales bacterium]